MPHLVGAAHLGRRPVLLAKLVQQSRLLHPHNSPPQLQPTLQCYRFEPQPVQLAVPTVAGSAAKPFCLLNRLLQQGPQEQLATVEPLLLDVPLPQGGRVEPDAAAPSSLRRDLEQLAAGSDSSGAAEAAAEAAAAAAGFVGLKSLGAQPEQQAADSGSSVDHAALLLKRLGAAPKPIQLQEPSPAAALPSFLLPPSAQPGADLAEPAASPAARTAAGGSTHQLLLLEPPVLPAAAAVRATTLVAGAPTSAFAHLFQPLPVPPAPAADSARCLVPEGCQPVSLATLVAQDMILDDDGGLMLPPVQMEEPGEADSPGGCCGCATAACLVCGLVIGAWPWLLAIRELHLLYTLEVSRSALQHQSYHVCRALHPPPLPCSPRTAAAHPVRVRLQGHQHHPPGPVPELVGVCRVGETQQKWLW